MATAISHPSVVTVVDGLLDTSARFAAMLWGVRDPSLPAIGTWNIGETAAHASMNHVYFLRVARGEAEVVDLDRMAEVNARVLDAHPEREPRFLAERLATGEGELAEYALSVAGDPMVEAFRDVKVPLSTVLCIEMGELLVHGYDIARAAGLSWRIDTGLAALTIEGFIPLLPFDVDPERAAGVHASLDLHVNNGTHDVVTIDEGTLQVEPSSDQTVDCHVSVDPATFLLMIFHRIGTVSSILRGKLMVWGRRPWKALELESVLKPL